MKRFYCTICKRIKRARKWPVILQDKSAIHAEHRVGECNHHKMVARAIANTSRQTKVGAR